MYPLRSYAAFSGVTKLNCQPPIQPVEPEDDDPPDEEELDELDEDDDDEEDDPPELDEDDEELDDDPPELDEEDEPLTEQGPTTQEATEAMLSTALKALTLFPIGLPAWVIAISPVDMRIFLISSCVSEQFFSSNNAATPTA